MGQSRVTRLQWVDYAKGICIFGVVSLYAVTKVSGTWGEAGWMQYWADFARPFRMPDFFFLSGLFLSATIDRPWRVYLDRKVVHYLYFFLLWSFVYLALDAVAERTGIWSSDDGKSVIDQLLFFPFSMLWFIQILPVFFLVARLLRPVPPWLVLAAAALLQIFPIDVEWTNQVTHFCERFVFFYAGYILGPRTLIWMDQAGSRPALSMAVFAGWVALNGFAVFAGVDQWPVVSLVLGIAGVLGIALLATLFTKSALFAPVRIIGEQSLIVYVGFFLPLMAGTVAAKVLKLPIDEGSLALLLTLLSIVGALIMAWSAKKLHLGWFFSRPPAAMITPR